jgi:hypothetical protein
MIGMQYRSTIDTRILQPFLYERPLFFCFIEYVEGNEDYPLIRLKIEKPFLKNCCNSPKGEVSGLRCVPQPWSLSFIYPSLSQKEAHINPFNYSPHLSYYCAVHTQEKVCFSVSNPVSLYYAFCRYMKSSSDYLLAPMILGQERESERERSST